MYVLKLLPGSSQKAPTKVIVDGCDSTPCRVKKGNDLNVEIHFTTASSVSSLKPQLSAKVFGIKMPLSVPKDLQNACENLKEGKCPLSSNQDVIYSVKLPILKSYPAMKTEIEMNLVGENGKSHTCFRLDGQIVN